MLGPAVFVAAMAVAGAAAAGWAGALAAGGTGLFVVGAVAVAAAAWARRVGPFLTREEAWAAAPRPPLFGRMVEAIYRRTLETGPHQE